MVVRYGVRKILVLGAVMTAATNLLFVWLAQMPPDIVTLAVVVSADNLSGGIANVALIAWLSSMTSASFTATQYALFSSLMTLPGKFLGAFPVSWSPTSATRSSSWWRAPWVCRRFCCPCIC